jgi:hypothetical protein
MLSRNFEPLQCDNESIRFYAVFAVFTLISCTKRKTCGEISDSAVQFCCCGQSSVADRLMGMRFERIWVQQCRATRRIRRQFGAKSALDYLIGEKLIRFAEAAEQHPEFAKELPRFLAAIWRTFNEYELAGYVASMKRATRMQLQRLLYLR